MLAATTRSRPVKPKIFIPCVVAAALAGFVAGTKVTGSQLAADTPQSAEPLGEALASDVRQDDAPVHRREPSHEIARLRAANQDLARELALSQSELAQLKPAAVEERHPNGLIRLKGSTVGGLREGTWQSFHLNGQKESEGDYVRGKRMGKWTFWLENGEVQSRGRFVDDKREGEWWILDVDGTRTPVRFENGVVKE